MRERTGQIFKNEKTGKWVARVGYTNASGKRTALQGSAETKKDAKKVLKRLLAELDSEIREVPERPDITFDDLLEYYERTYAKPAKFLDDRKIEGMRNVDRVRGFLKVFRGHFGGMKLSSITYDHILSFRSARLNVPTHYKRPRNMATMNRELSCLRRVFNIAIRQGWLDRNPVNAGEPLIDIAAERRRERILTLEEEQRLLAACTGKEAYIRPLVICLLDTGARRGETLKLRFSDLDFERSLITFRAMNTKTLKTRRVAMTRRVHDELQALWLASVGADPNALVFNMKRVDKPFERACRAAGIETGRPFGITLHSLRHTAATRLVKGQMPIQMVGRILSHQNPQTTYRYLTANDETLYQAASILESLQKGEG